MRYTCFLMCLLGYSLHARADIGQKVDFRIEVLLDDRSHMLRGYETISYRNQSADTLRFLYIHLWPNAYRGDRTAFAQEQIRLRKKDFYFASESERGFIDSLQFRTGQYILDWSYTDESEDIARVELANPLPPGDSLLIHTPFRVKLPALFSRMGHREGAYYITQWYPKPAVYDHEGWHPLHYLDQGEFYSEFGSYDVSLTLPASYIVMATGNVCDSVEQARMDSLAALPEEALSFVPPSDSVLRTIHFHEDRVHDFAWFADRRWILRKQIYAGTAAADSVAVYTAFLPEHRKEWTEAADMAIFALQQYGTRVGPYPYRSLKVVEGNLEAGGGMEYPTVALIDQAAQSSLFPVIAHEVGHNWFYGILGSDERTHPWMDEGLNSYYERLCRREWCGHKGLSLRDGHEDLFLFYRQLRAEDQAAELPADQYDPLNYAADIYTKVPLHLSDLAACVGESALDSVMQRYYRDFRFGHPRPDDFLRVLHQGLGARYPVRGWWTSVLKSSEPLRLRLSSATQKGDSLLVCLYNRSAADAPAVLQVAAADSSFVFPVWLKPGVASLVSLPLPAGFSWSSVQLQSAADIHLWDNYLNRSKPLWLRKGISLYPAFGIQRAARYRIFATTFPGYNVYDGPALGILLHNLSVPGNRLQFAGGIQIGAYSKHLNGVAAIAYSWYFRSTPFRELRLQADLKHFSADKSSLNLSRPLFSSYMKWAPSVEVRFRHKNTAVQSNLLLKQYTIAEHSFVYRQSAVDSLYRPELSRHLQYYLLARYHWYNEKVFHPGGFMAQAELGRSFLKIGLEGSKRIDYDVPAKSLYLRAFAGKIFSLQSLAVDPRYWLNSTFTGANDYLYDALYLGRNEREGLAARQVSLQEGGAKLPTALYANPPGRSDDWLLGLNVRSDVPFLPLPLRAYLDVQVVPPAVRRYAGSAAVLYQSGIELHLFRDLLKVYLPLVLSKDYSAYLRSVYGKDRLLKSITFSVQLQRVNWMRGHEYLFRQLVP